MEPTQFRLENNSLYNYIKNQVLPIRFSEHISNESLEYDSSIGGYITNSLMQPSPTSRGRGWVYFDDAIVNGTTVVNVGAEQSSKVSVVGASSYDIDYVNGAIKNPDTTPTSVSYYWNYVSVMMGWPGTTPPSLPLVSILVDYSEKSGFQLGPGVKNTRSVSFHVFATSPEERDDLLESIHDSIHDKTINILDFSDGDYLNYDGTFNTDLSLPLVAISSLYFISTTSRIIYVEDSWTDLNMYRGVVNGTYESLVY